MIVIGKKKKRELKLGSIASFDEDETPKYIASTLGLVDDKGLFIDVLRNDEEHQVYLDEKSARKAFEEGKLKIHEPYCYSLYPYEQVFPDISKLKYQRDMIDYLKAYNENNEVAIFWTFLDAEEKEKLREKQKKLNRFEY